MTLYVQQRFPENFKQITATEIVLQKGLQNSNKTSVVECIFRKAAGIKSSNLLRMDSTT